MTSASAFDDEEFARDFSPTAKSDDVFRVSSSHNFPNLTTTIHLSSSQHSKKKSFSLLRPRFVSVIMATLYIFYGSATGNAEGIAKDLAEKPAPSPFSQIVCEPLDKFKKFLPIWEQEPTEVDGQSKHGVIFISSTTGNGDAPENASRFARYIKRKQTAETMPFSKVAFATLGLGDTNYDQFCATGRAIDKRVGELGGVHAKQLACADEATGLEDVVEPWVDSVFADMVKACFGGEAGTSSTSDAQAKEESSKEETKEDPVTEESSAPPAPVETASTTSAPPPEKSDSPLFILYTSATGNCEQIAKDLAGTYEGILKNPDTVTFFPSVVCCDLNQFKKQCLPIWEQEPAAGTKHGVLIVAATTGNGDVPENGDRFVRFIKRRQTEEYQPLKHVCYSVLACGDSNYDIFCATGKYIDKRLKQVGGTRAKPLACADEATGLEEVVDPWVNSILMDITTACRGNSGAVTAAPAKSSIKKVSSVMVEIKEDEEEKKSEPTAPINESKLSDGVKIVRSILGLRPSDPCPAIQPRELPGLGASRSSCELLLHDDDFDAEENRRRGYSVDEETGERIYYTINRPYSASILGARYLTNTSTEGARKVCEAAGPTGLSSDEVILSTRDCINSAFPLTAPQAERNGKRVIELTLSLPQDHTFKHQPGDSLGLVSENTPEAVKFILAMLKEKHGIEPTQKISIDSGKPITLEQAMRTQIDLSSPIKSKRVLYSLVQFASNEEEANTLRVMSSKTKAGEQLFEEYIVKQRKSMVDVLLDFPSCQSVDLNGLLAVLPAIPPRYYSVSSSPLDTSRSDHSLTISFSVVDYMTPSLMVNGKELGNRRIYGLATRYLEALAAPFLCGSKSCSSNIPLKIFPKPTAEFLLPPSLETPITLIGPGTGIAPFMGFLAHRKALLAETKDGSANVGSVDVYFGCRHAEHDYLYKQELEQFCQDGTISKLNVAFSRDGSKTKYVQDIMKTDDECASRLVDLLLHKAGALYICGDGNKMGREVQQAIAELLARELDGGVEAGQAYIQELKSKGRFVLDIWS